MTEKSPQTYEHLAGYEGVAHALALKIFHLAGVWEQDQQESCSTAAKLLLSDDPNKAIPLLVYGLGLTREEQREVMDEAVRIRLQLMMALNIVGALTVLNKSLWDTRR